MPAIFPTRTVFAFFKTLLEEALAHNPADYIDDPGPPIVYNMPLLGVDWVKRFEGSASQAVKVGLESLSGGFYKAGIIIAMSTITPEEIDAAGVEFGLDTPITIILLKQHEGTADQEKMANDLDDLMDAMYEALDPLLYDPTLIIPDNDEFYTYNLLNIFALQGASDWKGRRFVYMARRSVVR